MTERVVVIGGGIAGLSTAYRILQDPEAPEVTVLEADDRPGGKVLGVEVGDLRLEAGPDSLLARKPAGVELCRELGLGDALTPPSTGSTHIWSRAGLLRFPSGPFGISTDPVQLWRWPGMSRRGKIRAAGDLIRRARTEETDESLGSLLRRRIGDEATESLVAPLLGGLFAGDVDRLSVRATFPELAVWERAHGSLMRGARATAAASRGRTPTPMFLRLRGGLDRLADALVDAIGRERIRLGTTVDEVRSNGDGFVVHAGDLRLEADAVVLATPAFATAALVRDVADEAVEPLGTIPYVSTAVVLLVYPEGTNEGLPTSSGFVVPRGMLAMTACTLVSRKWPDPDFGDRAVVRCFVGAEGTEELVEQPDDDIVEGVCRQLAAILPLPERAGHARVVRWPRAMPQYEVGHLDRVARIEGALPAGMFVVGQAYHGAGIPDCVRAGGEVAARVRSHLRGDVEQERVG